MARETIGYVRLEWVCPNCSSRNPGPHKFCSGCGAPQPENVAFEKVSDQLVTEEKEKEKAAAGADIHCGFCGARNPAGTAVCVQCGADLKEGKVRPTGQVVGAFAGGPTGQVKCPACGTDNPADGLRCQKCGSPLVVPKPGAAAPGAPANPWLKYILIGGALLFLFLCGLLAVNLFSREDTAATVASALWTREVVLEQYGPRENTGWKADIPAEAALGGCEKKYHHTQSEPAENSEKVCGTPYVVDQGSGYGKVVQDCQYAVYQDYCEYTVDAWAAVDTLRLEGSSNRGVMPSWPETQLKSNQRYGSRSENYVIQFETDQGTLEFTTTDADLFAQAQPGTRWQLTLNGFGAIVEIQAAD